MNRNNFDRALDCDTHNIFMDETPAAITIQDVAARASVSAMTVSRVINHPARVAPVTRQRVEQAIRELGFVPNALARQLLRGRTHTLALLVSDIGNPFFTQIARGVEDVAQRNGYTVIFGNSDESVEKERQYLHALLGRRIDGLLIAPAGNGSRPMLDLLVHPELVQAAWDYFNNVQTKETKYQSFLRADDKPAIWLNKETMERYRPQMQKLYYDASKFDTYLEQLGIKYPTVK